MTERPKPPQGPPSILPDPCAGMVHPQTFRRGEMEKSVGGITLREHFAGEAMKSIVTGFLGNSRGEISMEYADIAVGAVKVADALLAELSKPAEGK